MSLYSGRSYTPSILKTSSTIQERIKATPKSASKVRFSLPHSQNVRKILQDFVKHNNTKDYQHLICLIRDSELTDDDLCSLLKEANNCISLLNNDLRLFTEVLLKIQWANRNKDLVKEYQMFLLNLLAGHSFHASVVINNLVTLFLPYPTDLIWENGNPTEEDSKRFSNVHQVLETILERLPLSKDIFIEALYRYYPYFKRGVHMNDCYLYNLLEVVKYAPNLKYDILDFIFSKLIAIDVNVPRDFIKKVYLENGKDELFKDEKTTTTYDSIAVETLDVCLKRMFKFIQKECQNSETNEIDSDKTKAFFKNSLEIFDRVILRTHNSHHTQFCWFILFKIKPRLAETFIDHLWKKVTDPGCFRNLRLTSVQYIASLLVRASYVTLRLLRTYLQEFSSWIHSYIDAQDRIDSVNPTLKHSVFYHMCQALFYTTYLRHKELTETTKDRAFLQNLNFLKIISCRLNPLRVCHPVVVKHFAEFASNYQLAYCYTIIKQNARALVRKERQNHGGLGISLADNVLEDSYPFDPFVLKLSSEEITPVYIVHKEFDLNKKEDEDESSDEDLDEFLDLKNEPNNKRMKLSND
ncbi:RNA polymerase I-specific transcription initiation factor RRN3 [Harmonia axyridis]|uniref:RNA polymerase I-specific transcription initiation factor RRN3 n=1 Tax=Harmonia axyridis TaxID=115357 RepID=UPI001E276112|nr:RNA polymerase I-specific transcription initiation factor RRN3 [Harmonia axyridis]